MKVLVINSYAGSITLGASSLGCEIVGSYEDKNFFLDAQKANFPDIDFRSYRKDWPNQDLSDVVVVAHPPCSAFSVQNSSKSARGVNSAAFACTKEVLAYAMKNDAAAIAVESVMGALGGAWEVHQQFADTHGYYLYRILENGCMFGCQWRERFWAVWVRKQENVSRNFTIKITPNFKTVRQVVEGYEDGPSPGNLDKLLHEQRERLELEAKLTPEEISFIFDKQEKPHRTTAMGNILWELKYKKPDSFPEDKQDMFEDFIGGFASGTMAFLDPNGFTPVLMGSSFWYYEGRCLSETGFKRVMGFPVDYIFPESPRNLRRDMRTGLSKGVMPPIAAWITEEIGHHLGMRNRARRADVDSYELTCEPNKIADFRIKKDAWWERDTTLPPLRQFDDEAFEVKRSQGKNNP